MNFQNPLTIRDDVCLTIGEIHSRGIQNQSSIPRGKTLILEGVIGHFDEVFRPLIDRNRRVIGYHVGMDVTRSFVSCTLITRIGDTELGI